MNKTLHVGWERDANGRLAPKEAYFLTQRRVMPDGRVTWCDEDDDVIRRVAAELRSAQAAAIELGRTRNAVISRAKRIKVTFTSIPSLAIRAPRRKRVLGLSTDTATPAISKEKRADMGKREAIALAISADWRPKRIAFMGLKPEHCRWPLWATGAAFADKFYCGLTVLQGQSYCAHCAGLSYNAKHTTDMDRRLNLKKLRSLS